MRVFFFIFILNIGITYSQVCYLGFSGSVDNICDIDSPNLFDDSKVSAADPIIEQILNEVGGSKRFIVTSECDDLNTAIAYLKDDYRYILYDPEFIRDIDNNSESWENLLVLAHEIGHHLKFHTMPSVFGSLSELYMQEQEQLRSLEIEADEFAGFILQKLGATIDETTSSMRNILTRTNNLASSHPSVEIRVDAVKKGWENAKANVGDRELSMGIEDYYNLGREKMIEGKYEEALEAYSVAVQFDTEKSESYLYRAEAWIKLKNFDKAINDLVLSSKLGPTYKAYSALGSIYFNLGKYEKSLEYFNLSVKLDDNNSFDLYHLGMIYGYLKKPIKKYDFLKKSISSIINKKEYENSILFDAINELTKNYLEFECNTTTIDEIKFSYKEKYKLILFDDMDDGWNGASINVGGVDYTMKKGGKKIINLVCNTYPDCKYEVFLSNPGSYVDEIYWKIEDKNGIKIIEAPYLDEDGNNEYDIDIDYLMYGCNELNSEILVDYLKDVRKKSLNNPQVSLAIASILNKFYGFNGLLEKANANSATPLSTLQIYFPEILENYLISDSENEKIKGLSISDLNIIIAFFYYESLNDYKNALKYINKSLKLEENGLALYLKSKWSKDKTESIESLSKAVKIDPNNAIYHYEKGKQLINLHDYNNALIHFNKSLEIIKKSGDLIFISNNIYLQDITYYFELNDLFLDLYRSLAYISIKTNDYINAIRYYKKIIKIQDSPDLNIKIAELFEKAKIFDSVILYNNNARNQIIKRGPNPQGGTIHYSLDSINNIIAKSNVKINNYSLIKNSLSIKEISNYCIYVDCYANKLILSSSNRIDDYILKNLYLIAFNNDNNIYRIISLKDKEITFKDQFIYIDLNFELRNKSSISLYHSIEDFNIEYNYSAKFAENINDMLLIDSFQIN